MNIVSAKLPTNIQTPSNFNNFLILHIYKSLYAGINHEVVGLFCFSLVQNSTFTYLKEKINELGVVRGNPLRK